MVVASMRRRSGRRGGRRGVEGDRGGGGVRSGWFFFFKQKTAYEIGEEGGEGLVGHRQVIFFDDGVHAGVVEAVGVPAAGGDALAADGVGEIDGDEFGAGFDESAGEEAGLAV